MTRSAQFTSVELCAGAGGQALGLEQAGFRHLAAIENDKWACASLRANRDYSGLAEELRWPVQERDLHDVDGSDFDGVDLVAGGVPCPPFSVAGRQLGAEDERDLFPKALEIVERARPRAVMLENVRGLSQPRFANYRAQVIQHLESMGYQSEWKLLNSSDYGVPQLRPRFVLVALGEQEMRHFEWPSQVPTDLTVGDALYSLMAANGWAGVDEWKKQANKIAPTLVGGSKKHGGPDLGPTRSKQAWAKLGVKASSIAEDAPSQDFPGDEMPRLTVQMGAVLQGFPENWKFLGGKTAAWRQVGNAFPPPVARAIGQQISKALMAVDSGQRTPIHSSVGQIA
ncbi:DNA cytosine methyltransferase [Kocuria sp. CPCC 205235]|uniref:DNA cytosine methyltransferase n=1 Tax=Kocuria sp. CPCC 205235 TaxID=3073549 RepID=UPI0034D79CA7